MKKIKLKLKWNGNVMGPYNASDDYVCVDEENVSYKFLKSLGIEIIEVSERATFECVKTASGTVLSYDLDLYLKRLRNGQCVRVTVEPIEGEE